MSAGPTDRRAAGAALLLAALALAPSAGARADVDASGRPVFFRKPDDATAARIDWAIDSGFASPPPTDREQARDALHEIGYWSVTRLLDTVKRGKAQVQNNALLVLGRLGDRRAVPGARDEVRDEMSEWPPAVAALVLGRFRDAEEPTLVAFREAVASKENPKRKVAVALALGKIQRKAPVEGAFLLGEILDRPTPNPAVHYAALLALGFYRGKVAEQAPDQAGFQPSERFRNALKGNDRGIRLSAVLALALSPQDSFRPVFVDLYRNDGDREVQRAALLALGRPAPDRRPDPEITALLVDALTSTRSGVEVRRMAVYLLNLRGDPASLDALRAAASQPGSPEIAAASLVALGGIDDPRVPGLLLGKLSAANATVRAAAAVACTRLREAGDLRRARDLMGRRLQQGEPDPGARDDFQKAYDEIGKILRDRDDLANGREPRKRPPVEWSEADAKDLFYVLGRTHRERVFDLVNLRVLQVLGIDSLFEYRPNEPFGTPPDIPGGGSGDGSRPRRFHQEYGDQYDVRNELQRRPFYGPEDDPDVQPAPVPR